MAGRFENGPAFVGLPGNPVSSMVCASVFLAPVLRKMMGSRVVENEIITAKLAAPIGPNGPREHYMRGRYWFEDGQIIAESFDRQDSGLTSVLAASNALIIRAPDAPAAQAGDDIQIVLVKNI